MGHGTHVAGVIAGKGKVYRGVAPAAKIIAAVDDIWYTVVRYDTAHGFAHRDIVNIKGDVKKTPLFNQDYNNALTFAENDLKLNWEYYKELFLEGKDE